MDSREKTAGKDERKLEDGRWIKEVGERAFDKICKGRKLNPRQKYQKWSPAHPTPHPTPLPASLSSTFSSDWWREQKQFWIFNESPLGPSTTPGLCMPLSRKVLLHLLHFTQFRCAPKRQYIQILPVTHKSLNEKCLSFTALHRQQSTV